MTPTSHLRERLAEAGLHAHVDAVVALARPAVLLQHADFASPPGGTRVGGDPDLPADTPWPRWKGAPLAFVAQLAPADLRGLPGIEPLPDDGLLSFFYDTEGETWGFDPKDAGSFAVLYSTAGTPLVRREPPSDLPGDARFEPVALRPEPMLSLPSAGSDAVSALDLDEAEAEDYGELAYGEGDGPRHQVLGYAQPVQGEMELDCALVTNGLDLGDPSGYEDPRAKSLEAGAAEWRLLLQVDTDDDASMMWGDVGMLYFWIRDADLRARRFDRAWMIMQCH